MSNLTDFFPVPTGGGDSAIVTDPTKLPFICTRQWAFAKKDSAIKYSGASEFWEVVENYGVRAVTTASDTYKTVADVTGSGYFNYSISPAGLGTTVVTAKFTIDGVVTEIPLTINKYSGYSGGRAIIGAYCVGRGSQSTGDYVGFGSYGGDSGYIPNGAEFPTSGEYQASNITLLRPDFFNFPGAPKLRFETSFKLEYKTANWSSADYANFTGVSYKLD